MLLSDSNIIWIHQYLCFDQQSKQELFYIVKNEIKQFAIQYLPKGFIYGILISVFYFIVLSGIYVFWHHFIRKDNIRLGKWLLAIIRSSIFLCAFITYLYIVLGITIWSRAFGTTQDINLTLFSTFTTSLQSRIFVVENILLFIPFGFLLPLIWKKMYQFPWCILLGSVGSIYIEYTQYHLACGLSQLDDIMNNTLGATIGYFTILIGHEIIIFISYVKKRILEKNRHG